jgi:hypothetical protein
MIVTHEEARQGGIPDHGKEILCYINSLCACSCPLLISSLYQIAVLPNTAGTRYSEAESNRIFCLIALPLCNLLSS